MNIVTSLDMPLHLAKFPLYQNPKALLYHAATRKYTFKSILAIEPKCLASLKIKSAPQTKKPKLQDSATLDHFAMDFISFEPQ
jgi:hypothetical protein